MIYVFWVNKRSIIMALILISRYASVKKTISISLQFKYLNTILYVVVNNLTIYIYIYI